MTTVSLLLFVQLYLSSFSGGGGGSIFGAILFQTVTGYSYIACLIFFTAVVMFYVTVGAF